MAGKAETFGGLLRAARLAAGMSQSDLSQLSGLPKPTLSRYENGHVLPSLSTLRKLADALHVGESSLLPGSKSPAETFLDALRVHGIEVDTTDQAQKLADDVDEYLHDKEDRLREAE
jgi:transcriptional regulator with XRE-family HTH domain